MRTLTEPILKSEEWAELHRFFPVTRHYRSLVQKYKDKTDLGLGDELRLSKANDFLQVTADTHFKRRSPGEIHLNWSMTTEERLQTALMALADEMGYKSNPPWAVFAYGKLGSFELNLSSDVDLVWIREPGFEDTQKCLKRFRELIGDSTEFGFCHRLDFDLRAGGRLGPMVSTLDEWIDYFSNFGEAWERLAFVRFRPIWGSSTIIEAAKEASLKFTYRRYLDFSLIEAFKELRQKIHEQNWQRSKDGQIDLKLGLGGIRDLELFVHTMQVVYGGKSPSVRVTSTSAALIELQAIKALSAKDAEFLDEHYWRLRQFENTVQARGDQQTHILNISEWSDYFTAEQIQNLVADMEVCQKLVSGFLGPIDQQRRSLPESEEDQRQWLSDLGLNDDLFIAEWQPMLQQEVLSRQRERDDRWRKVFLFQFLTEAHTIGADINTLMPRLSEFVRKIRAKASLFHLLVHHPDLVNNLVRLLTQSDYLGQILIHRPELLDSFIYQQRPEIHENLGWEQRHDIWLDQKLLSEIQSGLEFLQKKDLASVLVQQTATADQICLEVLNSLKREFHSDLRILALGKWGARELGLKSDLDFIFISSRPPEKIDQQVARRFLNRLTQAPALFSVDLRLKPFGNSGVLVTTWSDVEEYLGKEAEAWLRQVYLRARLLGDGPSDNTHGDHVQKIYSTIIQRSLNTNELLELNRIRIELIVQNAGKNPVKFAPGGLVEIELAIQSAILKQKIPIEGPSTEQHFSALMQQDLGHKSSWEELRKIYWELRNEDQYIRLAADANASEVAAKIASLLSGSSALLLSLDPRQTAK